MISYFVKRLFGRALSCAQASDFLADYYDDSLDPRVRRLFEEHVAMCATCTTLLDQYRRTIELVRDTDAALPAPPPELAESTLDFLRKHLQNPPDGMATS